MEWRVLWMVKWLLLQIWCTVFRQSMPFVVDRVLQMKDQSNEFFLALQQIADYVRSIHTLASAAYGWQRASPGIATSANWPLATVWLTDKPSQSALAYKHASWDSKQNTWPCYIWKQERGVLRPCCIWKQERGVLRPYCIWKQERGVLRPNPLWLTGLKAPTN